MRKGSIIVVGLILLFFIGKCIYFVGGVSSTIPPIKAYLYRGSVDQFGEALEKYAASNSDRGFRISHLAGSGDIDLQIHTTDKHLAFGLMCRKVEGVDVINSEIDLVEARDMAHNIGGYGINADGMKELLKYFENNILDSLKKNQQVIITSKPKSFFDRFHY
jgi:hypothetical protein